MKAVLCKSYGPPESLVVENIPSPTPGPGEVVVSVKAASVNFPDVLIIQNKYQVKLSSVRSTGWPIVRAMLWCPAASASCASGDSTASGVLSPCARSPAFDSARLTTYSR